MKKVIEIRKILSLTQQELANLLQVSRSIINLYVLGKRALPNSTTIKLGQLMIAFTNAKQNKNQQVQPVRLYVEEENTARLVKELQQKATECRSMAAKVQQQLQAMKEQHQLLSFRLTMIGSWLENLPGGTAGEKARLHYEIQREEISRKLIPFGLPEQFTLQHLANTLLNNAAAHENALDKLNRGQV